ncbi:hypothetical protein FH603_1398 [Spirosoma sp. LMG 31447]|uniref:Uncharacterized protein n=1 Tax=Spirosoma utsteinense TaxID=2585773 RepID=A0ABR6W443_9BACT|nr:hypothetical protein [Spirosoma utsteinense]
MMGELLLVISFDKRALISGDIQLLLSVVIFYYG